jgi:hypothetical protein
MVATCGSASAMLRDDRACDRSCNERVPYRASRCRRTARTAGWPIASTRPQDGVQGGMGAGALTDGAPGRGRSASAFARKSGRDMLSLSLSVTHNTSNFTMVACKASRARLRLARARERPRCFCKLAADAAKLRSASLDAAFGGKEARREDCAPVTCRSRGGALPSAARRRPGIIGGIQLLSKARPDEGNLSRHVKKADSANATPRR